MKLSSILAPVTATLALILATASASAQLGISAAFTADRLSSPQTRSTVYGPTLSLYYQHGPILAVGGDVRASFLNGNGATLNTINAGPRASVKIPVIPLRPYAEALGGFNSFTPTATSSSSHHFDYQLIGGLDLTFFPRLDWRVFEYAYTGSTDTLHANSFSTGLVFRLPI